jgi:hypothetical protein
MDKILDRLVERLKADAGDNLQSIVLYGSGASGEFREKHSDLNVLCLLYSVTPAELGKLHKAAKWLARKGHPLPLIFSFEELSRDADIYAIELLEIKANRRMLYGEDVFGSIEVPMTLHRLQVERELRHKLISLREGYVAAADSRKAILRLMTRSASTFALLFRHALIALGESGAGSKRDAVARLAALAGFDAGSFTPLFELRDGKRKARDVDPRAAFDHYLEAVTRAVSVLDQKFEELNY